MIPELPGQQNANKNSQKAQALVKWSLVEKLKRSEQPKGRYNHLSFFYKNFIYIHGGTTSRMKQLDSENETIFRFNLAQGKWQQQNINNTNKASIGTLSSHCGVVMQKGDLIIYGGSNSKGQCKNDLWMLNLQNLNLKKIEQKAQSGHDIPSPRQSASMLLYKEKFIILYGGINLNTDQMYNDFNIFNWENKKWYNCLGNYQYIINCRCLSSICLLNQKIYLFGGQYYTSDQESHFLNDFYQIEIKIKTESNKQKPTSITPIIIINRIVTHITPKQRGGHTLVPLGKEYLILMGGESQYCKQDKNLSIDPNNNVHSRGDVWIYSILDRKWLQMPMKNEIFRFRTAFGACKGTQQQIYLSAGMKNYENIYDDILKAQFNVAQIQAKFKNAKEQQSAHCLLCQEIKVNKLQWPFIIQDQYIKEILSLIQQPFSAFGMLIDNAHMLGSTILNISYEQKVSNTINFGMENQQASVITSNRKLQRYFRIQDNGKCFPNDQLQNSLVNFQAGLTYNAQGADKKMKYLIGKQNSKRQFGVNLKLGALKLSQTFLYINILAQEEVRVTLFQKRKVEEKKNQMTDERQEGKQRQEYICYYYCFNPQNGNMLRDYSPELKKKVQEKYFTYIQEAINKKNIKNVLFLFDLRPCKQQKALYADARLNDIVFGPEKSIIQLEKAGISIYEACDISLRSYISCLYLKNQVMKITLSVCNGEKKEIPAQMFLKKIDKMIQHKQILDLTQAVQSDCKFMELYYNPDLKKKVNGFHNGVLLYHKNRLITRYDIKLGETVKTCERKILKSGNQQLFNVFNMFGFMELPDVVPINIFKTDFIYTIMMEKLYSRLKYVMNFTIKKKKNFVFSQPRKIEAKIKNLQENDNKKPKQLHKDKAISKKENKFEYKKITNKSNQSYQLCQAPSKNQYQQSQLQFYQTPSQQPSQLQLRQQHILIQQEKEKGIQYSEAQKMQNLIQQKQQLIKQTIKDKIDAQKNDSNLENSQKKSQPYMMTPNNQMKSKETKEKIVSESIKRQINLRVRLAKEDVSKNK